MIARPRPAESPNALTPEQLRREREAYMRKQEKISNAALANLEGRPAQLWYHRRRTVQRGRGHATSAEIDEVMPSDDEIWAHRSRTGDQWAAELGVSGTPINRRMRARGWRGKPGVGGMSHAPCRECGDTTPVEQLSEDRVCGSCESEAREAA